MYYASDKNVFDALNQYRVDSATLANLFERRNIIVSKKTARDDLAEYFSRLPHDFYDHKTISEKLGVVPRRERTTSMNLVGKIDPDSVATVQFVAVECYWLKVSQTTSFHWWAGAVKVLMHTCSALTVCG
tara:strand:- start:8374 stop:8763 length:390 start_codon:yes stop_codon:yes gene_type:complete